MKLTKNLSNESVPIGHPGSIKELILFIGTYTGQGSKGIYAYRFNPDNGNLKSLGLMAKTDNPSFFAIDSSGYYLYAVNELDSFQNEQVGAISVFEINRKSGKLKKLQQISSLGAAPAHISLDMTGRNLMVANYNGGNFAVFPIKNNGQLGECTTFFQNKGSSADTDRQTDPHVHSIQATKNNKFVLAADLGTDQLLVFGHDANLGVLTKIDSDIVEMAPGSGPRHVAFSADGRFTYVISELKSTISVFSLDSDSGDMQIVQTLSTLPKDFDGINTAAEILIDDQGRFLYISNRGDESIGVFSIDPEKGSLTSVQWISSGGSGPRHFEIDPTGNWLFVANQYTDNIVVFHVDQQTGHLSRSTQVIDVSAPVCVRFMTTD